MNVLIFGLGLHGGGASAAVYFLNRRCNVCVTDLKTEQELEKPLESIRRTAAGSSALTLHLGHHRIDDFIKADLVIKNTAVPPSHPLLLHADRWETDLSYVLKRTRRPIAGVTGTKGKSSGAYALFSILSQFYRKTDIAGNMGISLFDIIDIADSCDAHQQTSASPIVIEFSSWQLRDLRHLGVLPNCRSALIPSLYPDHMNSYDSFHAYLSDKAYLAENCEILVMSSQARDVFRSHDFQFHKTATVIVDCRQPLEYIRNRYRTRVQRVLRKGKRDGAAGVENDGRNGEESGGSEIVCRKFSADELDSQLLSRWYALYAATADRGHFSVRSKTYIENIFACSRRIDTAVSRYSEDCCSSETRKSAVQASFFGAFAGNVLAAGVIIAETEEAAWYLYGASSGKYLKQGAMYRLQDAVIADVSSRVSWYDMYGIAPENMPRHPLSDLNLFKKGFGGFTVQRTGIIDVPYHPLLYSLFRIRERRRSRRRQSPRQHISSGLFLFSR